MRTIQLGYQITALLFLIGTNISTAQEPVFSGVTVSLKEDGTGSITVDSREASQPVASPSSDGVVIKSSGDRIQVLSDFSGFRDGVWAESGESNGSSGIQDGALVLSPDDAKRSAVGFPKSFQAPVDLRIALAGHSDGMFIAQFGNGHTAIVIALHGVDSPETEMAPGTVVIGSKSKGSDFSQALKVIHPEDTQQKYNFRSAALGTDRTNLSLAIRSEFPCAIQRVDIAAKFPPSFGIALDEKGSRVFIKRVISGGPSSAAGLKSGDVLMSVDGERTKGLQQTLELLASKSGSTPVKFGVKRFGRTRTVNVTPEVISKGAVSKWAGSVSESEDSTPTLDGEWSCIASEENGKIHDAAKIRQQRRRLIINGSSLQMQTDATWSGEFTLDPSNGHFDWKGKGPHHDRPVEWVGIYELKGDVLKLCFIFQRDNLAKRPTEFKSKPPAQPGLAHAFYTFRRAGGGR